MYKSSRNPVNDRRKFGVILIEANVRAFPIVLETTCTISVERESRIDL